MRKKDGSSPRIAVALRYDSKLDPVPRVVAKGHGAVADKIVEAATASGVHVETNEPLAASLAKLELDQQIPKELYRVVAEVIAFIQKTSKNVASR